MSNKLALKLSIIQQMRNEEKGKDRPSQRKKTKNDKFQGFCKTPEVLPLQSSIVPDRKDRSRSPSQSISHYFNMEKKSEQGEQVEKKAQQGSLARHGNSAHQGTSLHQEANEESAEKKMDSYKQVERFLMENVQLVPPDRRESFLISILTNRTRNQGQIQQYKVKKQEFKMQMKILRLIDKILSTNEPIQKKQKTILHLHKQIQGSTKKYTRLTQDEKRQLAGRFDNGQYGTNLTAQYGISPRNCTNIVKQFGDPEERAKNDPKKKKGIIDLAYYSLYISAYL